MSKRVIKIIGDIDHDQYSNFVEELEALEAKSNKLIEVELISHGGETYVGLAFYSRIRSSKCPIHITVRGHAMSAATIILAAGTKRRMCKDSWFMVHDDSLRVKEPTLKRTVNEFNHHERIEIQWAAILARHSKENKEFWRTASLNTAYFNAQECLALGIIDEVV